MNNIKMKQLAVVLGAACSSMLWAAPSVYAVKSGLLHIEPNDKSGNLSPPSYANSTIDAKGATQLGGGLVLAFSDNVRVELPVALPFDFDLHGGPGGISGVGKIGEVKSLPFTVFGQYHFNAHPTFKPYAGVGLTYAYFYDERGNAALSALTAGNPTTFTIDSKFAVTPQVGLSVVISKDYFVDVSAAYSFLETSAKLSTGQTIDTELNPSMYSVQFGTRF